MRPNSGGINVPCVQLQRRSAQLVDGRWKEVKSPTFQMQRKKGCPVAALPGLKGIQVVWKCAVIIPVPGCACIHPRKIEVTK